MFFDLGADKLTLFYRGVDQASNQGKGSFKKGGNFPLEEPSDFGLISNSNTSGRNHGGWGECPSILKWKFSHFFYKPFLIDFISTVAEIVKVEVKWKYIIF